MGGDQSGSMVWVEIISSAFGVITGIVTIVGWIAYMASSRFRHALRHRAPLIVRIAREFSDNVSSPAVIVASVAYVSAFALFFILPAGRISAIVRPPHPASVAFDLIFYAALIIAIIGSLRHARWQALVQRQKVQVIAWEGWEEEDLYESSFKGSLARDFLEFLLYVRGLGTVPVLFTSKGRGYDVIVSDAEFIPSYNRKNRLRRIDDEPDLESSWDAISATILRLFRPLIAPPGGPRRAIPCRFGFQEILARKALIERMGRDDLDITSAKSFAPDALMTRYPDIQIGIWDWYLPAISVLLQVSADEDTSLDKIRTVPRGRVEQCLQALEKSEYRDRITLIESLPEIAAGLRRAHTDIVYGAGSWALNTANDGIEIIRPNEGIFIWAECAGILSDSDTPDRNSMVSLIKHWLSPSTQMKLGQGRALRALPTNLAALRALAGSTARRTNSDHPARETLEWLCDVDEDVLRPGRLVVPRQLPIGENQRSEDLAAVEWELAWSEFVKWLRS